MQPQLHSLTRPGSLLRQETGLATKTSCLLKIDAFSDICNPETTCGGQKNRFRDFHKKEGRIISLLLFMVFLFIYSSLGLLWQRTADVGIPRLWALGINDEEYYIVAGFQLGGHFLE